MKKWFSFVLLGFVALDLSAQTSSFSYHGRLTEDGVPANGIYSFRFTLFDALTSGNAASGTLTAEPIPVSNGVFTVMLDLGANTFSGANRWLEISVRNNDSPLPFQTLAPRQLIASTPYAIMARTASTVVSGAVVKSINLLRDNVSLVAGANVTITSNANSLTISSTGGGGGGPWLLNGTSAYYNAGRVGIGTSSPQTPLEIVTGADGEGLRVRGPVSGNANISYISFHDSVGTQTGYVGDGSGGDRSVFLSSVSGDTVLVTAAGRVLNATPSGRVGIGTTLPEATLHVNGSIQVAPAVRWKSYHGSAFMPQYLNNPTFGTQGGLTVIDAFDTGNSGTVGYTGSSGGAYYFASVDLPDGCAVVDVCVDARDVHSSSDLYLVLGKINLVSGFVTEVATTFTSGSSSAIQHACNGAVNETIDNQNNVYFLRCRMASSGSNTHWLLAARLKYTVTSPLP